MKCYYEVKGNSEIHWKDNSLLYTEEPRTCKFNYGIILNVLRELLLNDVYIRISDERKK